MAVSERLGMFGQTAVQQQRIIVRKQEVMISMVPRSSGEAVQPRVADSLEDVPLFMATQLSTESIAKGNKKKSL